MHPPAGRFLRRDLILAVHGAGGVDLCGRQPFRVAGKAPPQRGLVHRGHPQTVSGKRTGDDGIGFACCHRVALHQTARQVAAQPGKQLLGKVFEHNASPAPVKTEAVLPSGVTKPYLKGGISYAGTQKNVAALRIR